MYKVEFIYGMEHYQTQTKEFEDKNQAHDHYIKCLKECKKGRAISVNIYQKLEGYSIFDQ